MRRTIIAMMLAVLVCTVAALAEQPTSASSKASISPPARPVALTATQYHALRSLQAAPEHSVAMSTSATYSVREKNLKFTRFSDDFWTVAYDVGWPGSYLAILLCAL